MTSACPSCGSLIPADAPDNQCPACLLGLFQAAPAEVEAEGQEVFGDYLIVREIARGAMGRVVEARHRRLERTVAIKMVHAGRLASPELVERFRLESGVAARLDHPHIVPVYEVGEQDGVHFFCMRRMTGGSLRERLDRYPDDPRAAARLLVDIADATHFAHQRGVIHRDLKPANILLDDEGRAFVADFGLAKLIEHDSGLSQTGAVLGSPAYMAPEQARGDQDQVSTASDIYGLGAILYHLVTGRPPHQADTALATLRRVMDEEIERPSRLNPRVDPDLEAILHKCLERDPARRYASADALASDLRLWLAGRATEARPAGPLLLLWKWSRRNPAYALLAAGLAASCLILFAYALSRQGDFSQTSGAPMEFMGTSVWIPPPAATVQNPTGISWTWVESDGRKTARLKLPSTAKGAVRVWLGRNAEPQQLQPGADGMVEFTVPSGVDEVRVAW